MLLYALCSASVQSVCCRGVSTLILSCPCLLRFLQSALQCTVLQRVSTLILWHSYVCLLLPALLAVHCVAESQASDPLAQLPMFAALLAAFLCSALCCRGVSTPDPLTQLPVLRFLQRSFAVRSVTESAPDPGWLLMFFASCSAPFAVHCVAGSL
jgi:hypothetical protein